MKHFPAPLRLARQAEVSLKSIIICSLAFIILSGSAIASRAATPISSIDGADMTPSVNFQLSDKEFCLQPIMEVNLSGYKSDADANDHNLFFYNNKVYALVWPLKKPATVRVYCFDPKSGNVTQTESQLPDDFQGQGDKTYASITPDGKLAVLELRNFNPNSGQTHYLTFGLFTFAEDGTLSDGQVWKQEYHTKNDPLYNHFIRTYSELISLEQISETQFIFNFGGWYGANSNPFVNQYMPSLYSITLNISESSVTPEFSAKTFTPDNTYLFSKSSSNIGDDCDLLFLFPLLNGNYIVQCYGGLQADQAKPDHISPLLIYEPQPETAAHIFKEAATTTPPAHCLGAWPFTLEDTNFIITPTNFDKNNGTQFTLSSWDGENLSSINSILPITPTNTSSATTTFPKSTQFPYPTDIYGMERPKCLTRQTDNGTEIYAYMPGSGFGAYRLTADLISSSIQDITDTPTAPAITLTGRTLTITPSPSSSATAPTTATLYNLAGQQTLTIPLSTSTTTTCDLPLPSGAYILRLGSTATKLLLP